ncbi:MAG: mechanosensitive ion channel domain-containing protein [Bacteroidota bacterium]
MRLRETIFGYLNVWLDKTIGFMPTLLYGIVVFIVGFWLAKRLDKWLLRYFGRRSYDTSLGGFIRSVVSYGLKIIVIIMVAGIIGLPTTSLFAVFGAAGLAIGLALQGSLANFAGGVLILIFKPFKVGDLITSLGETGIVKEIQIFNTILVTPDNKTIILANGAVSNNTIINVSKLGFLRVDMKIRIDYDEDIDTVRDIIMKVLLQDEMILKDPAPLVTVIDIFEGSSFLAIRPYAKTGDFWTVYNNTYKNVRKALIENSIKVHIPKQITFQG